MIGCAAKVAEVAASINGRQLGENDTLGVLFGRCASMNSQLVLVLLFAAVVNAQWSAWVDTPNAPCSDTCGYCGVKVVAERKCAVLGKCPGPAQRYEECGSAMCLWPKRRRTCCAGYVKGLLPDRTFQCVAASDKLKAKTRLL